VTLTKSSAHKVEHSRSRALGKHALSEVARLESSVIESAMSAATPDATMASIDAACRRRGGAYSQYSCKVVSWDDVSRGMGTGGSLSAYGPNITDTYLKSKNGVELFTVRPDNWNEKLGTVSASQVALITGNHKFGSSGLAPTTLRDVLKQAGTFGSYAGLDASKDLSNDVLDQRCSIRFQTTFLPVSAQLGGRETLEFATEAHNVRNRLQPRCPSAILVLGPAFACPV
jgi:hypothetical protein